MIKVQGQDLWRGGVKIGYVADKHVFDYTGKRLGYCAGNNIYDINGHRLAWLQGDYIYFTDSTNKIRIEDNERDVIGGSLSSVENAAIRLLLGD